MGQKRRLTVPGRYEKIKSICDFVSQGAREAGFGENGIFQLQLACDEACTNIIEHTYGGEDEGEIIVTWNVGEEEFTVVIKDRGDRFDPSDIPPPPVPPELKEEHDLQVGGLGVFFMRKLMDKVTFTYEEGAGNTLTMSKRLPDEANA